MSLRSYLILLLIIFLISSISVLLLLFNMDPTKNPELAFSLLFLGGFLALSSLFGPILFFCKKIYYRGDVNISTMNASTRQGVLLAIGCIFFQFLALYHIDSWHFILMAVMAILCVEVIFQALW